MKLFLTKLKHRDKKAITAPICAVLLCVLIITGGVFVFQSLFHHSPDTAPVTSPITSFQTLTLRLSGMRLTEEYELTCKGEQTQVSLYWFNYATGEETRVLQESATVDTKSVLELFNACQLAKWNGFHGKHPKNVTDGTMFHLDATVGEGKKIVADGSQNFPKHFHELETGFKKLLNLQ